MPAMFTNASLYTANHLPGLGDQDLGRFYIKNKAPSHSLLGGLNLNLITISRQECPLFEAINIVILN